MVQNIITDKIHTARSCQYDAGRIGTAALVSSVAVAGTAGAAVVVVVSGASVVVVVSSAGALEAAAASGSATVGCFVASDESAMAYRFPIRIEVGSCLFQQKTAVEHGKVLL